VLSRIKIREFVGFLFPCDRFLKCIDLLGCNLTSISSGQVARANDRLSFLFNLISSASSSFALRGSLLLDRGWLYVIKGLSKLKVDVSLYTTDLVIGLTLQDVNSVINSSILHVDSVSLVEGRIIG